MYMPANAGEILGISKTLSASADENSVTESGIIEKYYFDYVTNKGNLKKYQYNEKTDDDIEDGIVIDDNPYHVDVKANGDRSFDVVFYIPDDMSVSDTSFSFGIIFKYEETDYIFNKNINIIFSIIFWKIKIADTFIKSSPVITKIIRKF